MKKKQNITIKTLILHVQSIQKKNNHRFCCGWFKYVRGVPKTASILVLKTTSRVTWILPIM